ncbi:aspartyl-phosphate phosphatase Spo0E family protein [Bhargavaea ullalensis]|uniref:Ribosomal protein S13 n=1 Tax=Bhargavaea ullalensis TaxID=1265685 RepID=A0ABV2GBW3_9BACL
MESPFMHRIERVRLQMIETARIRGLDDRETIRLSRQLDRLMNVYGNLREGRRPVLIRCRRQASYQPIARVSPDCTSKSEKNM